MKLAIVGTGYVGLVSGTCFADRGHHVVCIDKDASKITSILSGRMPIYEPGLGELVARNVQAGRLRFTSDLRAGIADAEVVFIAVGTPQGHDGAADLSGIWAVGEEIAGHLTGSKIIVIKSTVPVGTNAELARRMAAVARVPFEVANNPEFLKEGAAIDDFNHPDRVVVGARSASVIETLREVYTPILAGTRPFLAMSPESAEMTKYAANCMLATKISFINEMANLCTALDADIDDVRQGIGHDARIGFSFLSPGLGYGGSCFPKDVRALIHLAKEKGEDASTLETVDAVNERQKVRFARSVVDHFGGDLKGLRIAVWGLAFKPNTDDIRESPALVLLETLLEAGAFVRVNDPQAMDHVRRSYGGRITFCEHRYSAVEQADALVIATDWEAYRSTDFLLLSSLMRGRVIFDGRNLLDGDRAAAHGFHYRGVGRGVVATARGSKGHVDHAHRIPSPPRHDARPDVPAPSWPFEDQALSSVLAATYVN